jgi:short-subunit dehydrogenase
MKDFLEKYGPVALIAGGSEGVGASYARLLAERGMDLILIARRTEPLETTREALLADFPERTVRLISADLTAPETPEMLARETADAEIGLFIYNAGSNWKNADFLDNDLSYAQTIAALNATTPLALTHHFGGLMRGRKRGGIILVGSLAYLVGNPKLAIYSAAKSFTTTLAEALWFELKPYGVDVLAHVLGAVDTPFIARTFPDAVGRGAKPDDVVIAGLDALPDGPVLLAKGGPEFSAMLSGMSRPDAVRTAYQAGQAYKNK